MLVVVSGVEIWGLNYGWKVMEYGVSTVMLRLYLVMIEVNRDEKRKGKVLERVSKWNWEIEETCHLGDVLWPQSWDGVKGRIWMWVRFWFIEGDKGKMSACCQTKHGSSYVYNRRVYGHYVMSQKPVGRRWYLQNYVLEKPGD